MTGYMAYTWYSLFAIACKTHFRKFLNGWKRREEEKEEDDEDEYEEVEKQKWVARMGTRSS